MLLTRTLISVATPETPGWISESRDILAFRRRQMLPFTQQKEVDYAAVIEKHKGDKSGKKILMHVHASSHKEEGGGSPKSPSPKKAKPAKGVKGKIVDNPLSKADDNEVAPSATCVHVTRTQAIARNVSWASWVTTCAPVRTPRVTNSTLFCAY